MWPWILLLALAQVATTVCLWRHLRADDVRPLPPVPEVVPEEPEQEATSVTLDFTPVVVTATRNRSDDSATIVVSQGNHQFEYHTDVIGSDALPWVARVRQGVGWKGAYLFVMNENNGRLTRSATDAVLKLQDGRLVEVGTIARSHQARAEPLGPGYDGGCFHDRIDKFEGDVANFGTMNIGWEIVLREENGRFVTDLDATWKANAQRLKTNTDEGAAILKRGEKGRPAQKRLFGSFGENALVAMYCGRLQDAAQWMQRARQVLEPDALHQLETMARDLTPGEIPCYVP